MKSIKILNPCIYFQTPIICITRYCIISLALFWDIPYYINNLFFYCLIFFLFFFFWHFSEEICEVKRSLDDIVRSVKCKICRYSSVEITQYLAGKYDRISWLIDFIIDIWMWETEKWYGAKEILVSGFLRFHVSDQDDYHAQFWSV